MKINTVYKVSASMLVLFMNSHSALAEDDHRLDYLTVTIGYYDIFDDDDAIDFRVEYRPDSVIFIDHLKPWAGIEITSDASLWLGGGLLYDYPITDDWFVTPGFGAGYYAQGSSDLDLSNALQFRSQLEISYKFDNDSRAGVSFSHISNGGLSDDNPGTEVLSLSWSFPF